MLKSILTTFLATLGSKSIFAAYSLDRDPTYDDFIDVQTLIQTMIDDSTCPDPEVVINHWDSDGIEGGDCVLFPRSEGNRPLLPRLVRLAFHDAAGNLDAFVNFQDPENNGLLPAVIVLDDIYDNDVLPKSNDSIKNVISKADFYAWAGQVAVMYASVDHVPDMPVRWGRNTYVPTSDTDVGPKEDFPSHGGHSTADQIEQYFANKFGFNSTQSVTIMGAHTLGRGRRQNSGYDGRWVRQSLTFDSGYYKNIVDPIPVSCVGGGGGCEELEPTCCSTTCADRCLGWEMREVNNRRIDGIDNKFQWSHSCAADGTGCTEFMMHADISFFHDMEGYVCEGGDNCPVGQIKGFPPGSPCVWGESRILATCFPERDSTKFLVESYAFNNPEFVDAFAEVFDIMTQSTPDTLSAIEKVGEDSVANGDPCPDLNQPWCLSSGVRGEGFYCRGCISDNCVCGRNCTCRRP